MMQTVADLKDRLGVAPTCAALGLARASFYRSQRPRPARVARRPSPRALSPAERETALAVLHEPRFVDLAPGQVYTRLLVNGRPLRATQGRPMVSQRWTEPGPSQVVCPDRYSVRASCFSVGFPRRWAARCCLVCSAR
jgi:hypothetical protein